MKKEPVAWMETWENQDGELKHTVNIEQIGKQDIPLYTHPAELTDEDLDKLIKDAEQGGYMEMYIVGLIDGFNRARAMLRKAQEK